MNAQEKMWKSRGRVIFLPLGIKQTKKAKILEDCRFLIMSLRIPRALKRRNFIIIININDCFSRREKANLVPYSILFLKWISTANFYKYV